MADKTATERRNAIIATTPDNIDEEAVAFEGRDEPLDAETEAKCRKVFSFLGMSSGARDLLDEQDREYNAGRL